MSFIYDDNRLIKELIEAGEKSMQKSAQTKQVAANPGDLPAVEIAQKLLFALQRDLGDAGAPSAGAPIGVEGVDPSQPGAALPTALPKDLRTLGDFLQWAAAKKITWEGKRFAWTPDEVAAKRDQPDDPTQKAWEFTSMRTDRNDRKVDRQPETVFAYADKDGLIGYLSYLRDSEDAKTNKVLAFMLATLIGEANAYLRQAGQPTVDPRKKPGAQADIDPETIVDVLPDPMELDKWNAGIDDHPFRGNTDTTKQLRVKNLKDAGSFQAWFRNRNVKVTTPATKEKPQAETKVFQATSSDGDPCIAIHILYKRANFLRTVAVGDDSVVPNYSKAAALYLQQVTAFGKNYTGADGKPCAVTAPGTTQPGQQPGQAGTQPGAGGKVTPQALHAVVQYMPLRLESFDFNKVTAFFSAYEQMLSGSGGENLAAVQGYRNIVSQALGDVKNNTLTPMDVFPLYGGADSVVQWLQPPQDKRYVSFIQKLMAALDATKNAIQLFYNSYAEQRSSEDRTIFTPEERQLVSSQIIGNSIYQSNYRAMSRWMNDKDRVIRFTK